MKSLSEWVDVTGLKVPVYLLALSSSLTATAPVLQLPLRDVEPPTTTAATLVPMRPKVPTPLMKSLSEWVDVTGLKVPVYVLALSSS
jgi:hypothetical protein